MTEPAPDESPSIDDAEVALIFAENPDGTWTATWEPPIAEPVTAADMWGCVDLAIAQVNAMDSPPPTVRFVFP